MRTAASTLSAVGEWGRGEREKERERERERDRERDREIENSYEKMKIRVNRSTDKHTFR